MEKYLKMKEKINTPVGLTKPWTELTVIGSDIMPPCHRSAGARRQ